MQVPGSAVAAVTAMNFSHRPVQECLDLRKVNGLSEDRLSGKLLDILTGEQLGELPQSGCMTIDLPALTARTIVIEKPAN
jgi:hypothetical protein